MCVVAWKSERVKEKAKKGRKKIKGNGFKWTKQSVIARRIDRIIWGLFLGWGHALTLTRTMSDKDNTRPYHYEPYPAKTNNTSSLKRNEIKTGSNTSSLIHNQPSKQSGSGSKCCCCTISARSATFWASFLTNLGICTLLFGYTLLGKWFGSY